MKKPVFRSRNTERARELRRDMTPAERHVWRYISRNQVDGWHFTKQFQIGPYFADFVCRKGKLVVELDGDSHATAQAYDGRRDAFIQAEGYRILRFSNEDALKSVEGLILRIEQALADTPSPAPSRKREGS